MPGPVVFLDKDGTLVEDVPHNADPARLRLLPGAGEAVRALHLAGWRLAVVTNQSGVARGLFPESALAGVETRLQELLADYGVPLAGFFYCPHHPGGIIPEYAIACECRKPAPGLILLACRTLVVDPGNCWVVGDSLSDVEAGQRAGCRTVLIQSGDADATRLESDRQVDDLIGAAEAILGRPTGDRT